METRIGLAERELRNALAGLRPEESFGIVAFYGRTRVWKKKLMPATAQNVVLANAFLDTLRLDNGTNLDRALAAAFKIPDLNLVVVITDGAPTYGETDPVKLARKVRGLNKTKARIDAVALVGRDENGVDNTFEAARLLQQIARDSGGEYRQVTAGKAE
jgi:Mg-chelatase subunit ChlD